MSDGLRASDADREATVERLHAAAAEGRLDAEELEQRIGAAYAARYCADLVPLTADITPPPAPPPIFVRARSRTNGLAVVSLICGLVWILWLGSLAAIVTGHAALRQIAASGGTQSGRGLALAGLALGYFGALTLALTILAVALG